MNRKLYHLVVLLWVAIAHPVSSFAQDRSAIEIVPNISHTDDIHSIALSFDGKRVLSGGRDGTVKLWDVFSGALVRPFYGGEDTRDSVKGVALSGDGNRALSAAGRTIKLWNMHTGDLIRSQDILEELTSVAFSPDGMLAAVGNPAYKVMVWEVMTGKVKHILEGHAVTVKSIAFSSDGTRILSAGADGTILTWNALSGVRTGTFTGHAASINSVTFSIDGSRIVSGSGDGINSKDNTVRLWNAATGELLRIVKAEVTRINAVAVSPDGMRIASASDRIVTLWDVATGTRLQTFEGHSSQVLSVFFSADGAHILSGSRDKTIKVWRVSTGALLRNIGGRSSEVNAIALSSDSMRLISGGNRNRTRIWDMSTGRAIHRLDITRTNSAGNMDFVDAVAISADGRWAASGAGTGGDVVLWETSTGGRVRTLGSLPIRGAITFSPDGSRVLIAGTEDAAVLFDAATGKRLKRFYEPHTSVVTSVAFSGDGSRIVTGSRDKTAKLWSAPTGAVLSNFEGHDSHVTSVAFSPDEQYVLTGGFDRNVNLWNASNGTLIRTFKGHGGPVTSVVFAANGSRIVSGSWDRTIKLWDLAGAELRTLKGHTGTVTSVATSSDGARVISGSLDGTIRVWNFETGELFALLTGQADEELAITPNGFFVASSPLAQEAVSIVRGLVAVSVQQVYQSLHNPDLVRIALAGDPDGEVKRAAKVINLKDVLDSGPPPEVALVLPDSGSTVGTDLVALTARLINKGKGVGRIEWRVNGVTVAVAQKPQGSGPEHDITRELALDSGENTIEVVAYNDSNLLASLPASAAISVAGAVDTTKARLHILAIGINSYIDKGWTEVERGLLRARKGFPPLKLAVKDAEAFGAAMKRAGAGMYQEVVITTVLNENATRENLEKVVGKIAKDIHPRDTFILFAAAHGTSENGRFYLIPQDYQGASGALKQRAIGQDQLQEWLANRIKAKKAIILLDTCESGALVAGHLLSRTEEAASEASVGRLHEATGRPVLTAAAWGQFAHEGLVAASGERQGIFTWALLDALRNGDTNHNGTIELSELVAHVQNAVPSLAAKSNGTARGEIAVSPTLGKQSARSGSRGENFAVVNRVQ